MKLLRFLLDHFPAVLIVIGIVGALITHDMDSFRFGVVIFVLYVILYEVRETRAELKAMRESESDSDKQLPTP